MHSSVRIAISDIRHATMSKIAPENTIRANRRSLLAMIEQPPEKAVLVKLEYTGVNYRRFTTVSARHAGDGITKQSSIVSDAMFTRETDLALLLPIADCIGAVLHDPINGVLGLAHLGRHNLVQHGGTGIIEYMTEEFGTEPSTISVWMSPAAGQANYPLYDFENRSLHEVALEQLCAAGIDEGRITIDRRDTTTDASLFSHSQFLNGNRPHDGRQAIVCVMQP